MRIQIASDLHLEMYAPQRRAPGGGSRSATDACGRPHAPDGGPVYPPTEAFAPVPGRDLLVLAGDIGTGDLHTAGAHVPKTGGEPNDRGLAGT